MQYNQNKHILKRYLNQILVYIKQARKVAKNADCLEYLKEIKDIETAISQLLEKIKKGV